MNAVLQCLSHTDILAEYFVLDQYKVDLKRRNKLNSRKFGTKGELTEQLAQVLKALWTCRNESDYSTSFKAVVDRYGTQFRSSTQHDAQEFLFWLLDKVHEDLNTASKRKYKSMKVSHIYLLSVHLKCQLENISIYLSKIMNEKKKQSSCVEKNDVNINSSISYRLILLLKYHRNIYFADVREVINTYV